MAAVAREVGVNALVNMSQMTVSQMGLQNTTPSPQQRPRFKSSRPDLSLSVRASVGSTEAAKGVVARVGRIDRSKLGSIAFGIVGSGALRRDSGAGSLLR